MDRRVLEYINIGTGSFIDPLRVRSYNTLKSKVGNIVSSFDKIIKKNPAGFTVDKRHLLGYLGMEKLTSYTRQIFKQYGYRLRVYTKKPYVHVMKHENTWNKRLTTP